MMSGSAETAMVLVSLVFIVADLSGGLQAARLIQPQLRSLLASSRL
jgi:hypothetical protein